MCTDFSNNPAENVPANANRRLKRVENQDSAGATPEKNGDFTITPAPNFLVTKSIVVATVTQAPLTVRTSITKSEIDDDGFGTLTGNAPVDLSWLFAQNEVGVTESS